MLVCDAQRAYVCSSTMLKMTRCGLGGAFDSTRTRTEPVRTLLTFCLLFAGELPKEPPVSLEVLKTSGVWNNPHESTGGIPHERGALANLKELEMRFCGLDSKLITRAEHLHPFCDVHLSGWSRQRGCDSQDRRGRRTMPRSDAHHMWETWSPRRRFLLARSAYTFSYKRLSLLCWPEWRGGVRYYVVHLSRALLWP